MTASAFLSAQGIKVVLAGRVVLNDVSLSLPSGHLVALVGPNGAGKTTLLRALAGLLPSSGAIDVGGDALSSLALRGRARRFAHLPDELREPCLAALEECAGLLPAFRRAAQRRQSRHRGAL